MLSAVGMMVVLERILVAPRLVVVSLLLAESPVVARIEMFVPAQVVLPCYPLEQLAAHG